MKNLILIFAVATIFSSCGKSTAEPDDNTSSGSNSKVSGSMKVSLNGKDWEAKTVSFGGLFALIEVVGKTDDNNFVSLQFTDTKLEVNKTYNLIIPALDENLGGNLVVMINGAPLFAGSGTFKITKYTRNKVIEGEINAELTDFIDKKGSIKNGTFSMKY